MRDTRGRSLAKLIEVYRTPGTNGLLLKVNGEVFPWFTRDGYHTSVTRDADVPGVTITIAAESVRVYDDIEESNQPDPFAVARDTDPLREVSVESDQ